MPPVSPFGIVYYFIQMDNLCCQNFRLISLIQFQGAPEDGDVSVLPERPSEPPCAVRYFSHEALLFLVLAI